MKPLKVLHETYAPDGTSVTLARHDREYLMLAGGKPLMSSRMHGSEEALATLGCRGVTSDRPRVLVGGLGMGFTLRAALDRLPANARSSSASCFRPSSNGTAARAGSA